MSIISIPVELLFVITIIIVLVAAEIGLRLGRAVSEKSADEKETNASSIAAAILTLAGFMLAFTFDVASARYQDRKQLVRDDADAIGTAWLRSDFLPEEDRVQAARLFRKYLDGRVYATQAHDTDQIPKLMGEAREIQYQLWDMAVRNARKDMNSDVYALYIESLNTLMKINALRIAIALEPQIPGLIWIALYALVILGMMAIGYHTAIAGSSHRSWATSILALSFALVITLVAALDNPRSRIIPPQEPLLDLQKEMAARPHT